MDDNMTTYSHSRLGMFQQCKQKYKFKYIDKVAVDIPDTIETFMGKRVHEALEKLYKDVQFQKLDTKEEVLAFFRGEWDARWVDTILIVKKEYSASNYKEMGVKFISDYYDHYTPFNSLTTIGLETEYRLELDEGNQYHIRMDRLSCDKEGTYYVCDYKTNNQLKAQGELDEDRQLAMYSLWVKQNFKDCKNVKLVWYFLAFDKEMISERNEEQLANLKMSVQELIKEIEICKEFPTTVTSLCNYCVYKSICPAWKHERELETKTEEEFKDDDGVKLVDEYEYVDRTKKQSEERLEEVKKKLISFSKQREISVVFGTNKKASVKEYEKISYDNNVIELIKEKGLFNEVATLNYSKLASKVIKGNFDADIIKLISKEKDYRISLSKRKDDE